MNELTDVREMRKAITEICYTRNGFAGGSPDYSVAGVLAHHCRNEAQHQGLSGEDAMTLLAYRALLRLDKTSAMLLKHTECTPSHVIFAATQSKEGV